MSSSLLRRIIRLENRVKVLEAARTAPSARLDDRMRAFILLNTKKPIKARVLEGKAFKEGFGKTKFRLVRAKLSGEGEIELYRTTDHWVWRRVAK